MIFSDFPAIPYSFSLFSKFQLPVPPPERKQRQQTQSEGEGDGEGGEGGGTPPVPTDIKSSDKKEEQAQISGIPIDEYIKKKRKQR